MSLSAGSSLRQAVRYVAGALEEAGIRAILTGGACASLHTGGKYQSSDMDFILRAEVSRKQVDEAMKSADFRRRGNRYEHRTAVFYVEFPVGPLAIGADLLVRPVFVRIGQVKVRTLSPTDSCRDRLAAFYHWNDRQSLETAVEIARRHRVGLAKIRRWSIGEGALGRYQEFLQRLARTRRRPGAPPRKARA